MIEVESKYYFDEIRPKKTITLSNFGYSHIGPEIVSFLRAYEHKIDYFRVSGLKKIFLNSADLIT